MLEIRLLGQFEVRQDGAPIEIPSRPAQALLAYLVLSPGIAHRRERLAGLLWPEASEANARSYLRKALWHVRKALEAGGRHFLLADDISIAFDANSRYWLDVSALEHMGGTTEGASPSVDELIGYLSVYQGELLPGFYDEWASLERERLRAAFERRMTLLLDRLIQEQRWTEVLEWGERWIALGHIPEPAYRALMVAHASLGDISSTAAVFRRCAEALRTELSVEPAEETRTLYERLVTQGALQRPPTPAMPREGAHQVPNNLPTQPTPFIGREQELAAIAAHLEDTACRLLTLIGPGGIGKTRLALEAAAHQLHIGAFPHGVLFVSLAPISSAEFLVSVVSGALRFAFYGPQDPRVQLLNYLGDRQMLLVMDNFEHVLEGAGFLAECLTSAPGVKFLVTSRERLNLLGEWLFEVEGMSVPERGQTEGTEDYSVVQLFLQSARRVWAGFTLSETEKPHVVRICQLVGGMPLGIELAAAHVRTLACREIAVEIEHSLSFLAASFRDAPERRRSLRATFDHSWKFLSEEERRAFRNLSVFRGGFGREAAEQATGASLLLLSALMDKSLLRRNAQGRYDMHELVRQYALDKLSEAGETETLRRRHRDWYLEFAERAAPAGLWGSVNVAVLNQFETERDNLRAALEWSMQHGEAEEGLRLTRALVWFWYVRSDFAEGQQWLERALTLSMGASAAIRADVMHRAGVMALQQGDYERAVPLLKAALELFLELGDPEAEWAILDLGLIAFYQGDHEQAATLMQESLDLFQAGGHGEHSASARIYLGLVAYYRGDYEQASALLQASLPTLREIDDGVGIARALHGLGMVTRRQGDYARAQALFAEGLTTARERGARLEIVQCLEGLAGAAYAQRQLRRAARLFGAAGTLRRTIGAALSPGARVDYERDVAAVRAQLDEKTFAMEWAEGQALTMEQAMEYALSGEHGSAE